MYGIRFKISIEIKLKARLIIDIMRIALIFIPNKFSNSENSITR